MRFPYKVKDLKSTQRNFDYLQGVLSGLSTNNTVMGAKIGNATLIGGTTLQFANIPQNFKHLRLYIVGQSNRAGFTSTGLRCRINGNASTLYHYVYDAWQAGAHFEGQATSEVWGFIGACPAGNRSNDDYISHHIVEFPWYSRSDQAKTFMAQSMGHSGSADLLSDWVTNSWEAIPAISDITVTDDVLGTLGPRAAAVLYGVN